ncbi:MAG TPA: hypothetical protein VNP94_10235 [Actinomycetota bacterium]|nr:hypothetical protein [Actinomycetota bacterium]
MREPPPLTIRVVPTPNRAATAIVRCRSHLLRAREEVRVALAILPQLDGPAPTDSPPAGAAGWAAAQARLEALLARLEELAAELDAGVLGPPASRTVPA